AFQTKAHGGIPGDRLDAKTARLKLSNHRSHLAARVGNKRREAATSQVKEKNPPGRTDRDSAVGRVEKRRGRLDRKRKAARPGVVLDLSVSQDNQPVRADE